MSQYHNSADSKLTEGTPLLYKAQERSEDASLSSRKSYARRYALAWLMISLFPALGILIFLNGVTAPKHHHGKSKLCVTQECIHASSEILYNLSPNYKDLDPCTDFERLICAGWDERHDLRPDQGDAFTGTIMSENSQTLLRHILEAPYPEDSQHSSFSPLNLAVAQASQDKDNFLKLKAAYDACTDEETIKATGLKPLLDIIKQVINIFPKSDSEGGLKDSNDYAPIITFLAQLGVPGLIQSSAGADDKNPDVVIIQVAPPYGGIGLPAKDYYKDENVLKKYEDTIDEVVKRFAFESEDISTKTTIESYRSRAHELVEFEKKLAASSLSSEDFGDITKVYNPFSVEEADKLAPPIQLSLILEALAPPDYKPDKIIVASPKYLKDLVSTLDDTPREVIGLYFVWKVIQEFAEYVDADAVKPYKEFSNQLQGKDPDSTPERWRTCVNHVDEGLGWILSRFFVEKAFSEKAKELGDRIVSDIKDQFIEKLKVTPWMDKSVIDLAIDKVHQIVQKIGYPTKSPNILDPPSLADYYKSVDINSTEYFNNALSLTRFAVARTWTALGRPVDRNQWDMTVPTVNAYYNPPGNEIVFPGGIMQFPVFDVNVPEYLSYGAFGSVSGHELSHAFDSTGRHYDQNGNYTDWWTNKTVAGFEKRADCFVEQYHNYTVPGPDDKPLHVNGRLTLGENIADAGGLSAAFSAWKKRRAEKPNQDLPGLEYFTQEQLFFVSYGNWWCGKSRKEKAIDRIYTDPHAPKWARILGTMANSRDFKESFKCPNKEPVCELW